jgi:transposase
VGSKYTKRYTEEFKRDAIALVDSSGMTVTAVARELGISSESLRGWYRRAKADRGEGESGRAHHDVQERLLARHLRLGHLKPPISRWSRWAASMAARASGPIRLSAQRLLMWRAHRQSGSPVSTGVWKDSTWMPWPSNA